MKSLCCAIAIMVLAGPLAAQGGGSHLAIGGGASFPVGKLDSALTAGPAALVALSTGLGDLPVGLRFDYSYNAFRGRTISGTRRPDAHVNAATADIIVPFNVGYVKPYFFGGAGWFSFRGAAAGAPKSNRLGYASGFGLSFPLLSTGIGAFTEVRYDYITASATTGQHFVPVTIGLMF